MSNLETKPPEVVSVAETGTGTATGTGTGTGDRIEILAPREVPLGGREP